MSHIGTLLASSSNWILNFPSEYHRNALRKIKQQNDVIDLGGKLIKTNNFHNFAKKSQAFNMLKNQLLALQMDYFFILGKTRIT